MVMKHHESRLCLLERDGNLGGVSLARCLGFQVCLDDNLCEGRTQGMSMLVGWQCRRQLWLMLSPKLLRHSAPFKMLNTNLFEQPGVNLRALRHSHHRHTEEYRFRGILSTTPLEDEGVFLITVT